MSTEEDARSAQLHKVFLKALDVSLEAVGPDVTRESFEAIKGTIGQNNIDAIIMKHMGKLKQNVEVRNFPAKLQSVSISDHRENSSNQPKETTFASSYRKMLLLPLYQVICKGLCKMCIVHKLR